jgi:CheY-like chemotaxis protein
MKKFNKVLLVEDEDIDAFLSKSVLQQMELSNDIIVCRDGQEALELIDSLAQENKLEKAGPELILLDIKMPGMDGLEFLQELRERYEKNFTVVILSSSNNPNDITQAARFSASYYLVKPITEDKVKKMVARCFSPAHLD